MTKEINNTEEIKENGTDVVEETTQVGTTDVSPEDKVNDTEKETASLLSSLKSFLTKQDKEDKQEEVEEKEELITLTKQELEEMVKQNVSEVVTNVAFKEKEKAKKQAIKENNAKLVEEKVSEEFRDFVTYKMENEDNFNLDEFLENNRKYKKTITTQTHVESKKSNDPYANLSKKDRAYAHLLKK